MPTLGQGSAASLVSQLEIPNRVARREGFFNRGGATYRAVRLRSGELSTTLVPMAEESRLDGPSPDEVDRTWLRSPTMPMAEGSTGVGIVDLFSGLGGLSLGVHEAARAVGRAGRAVGIDSDANAIATFAANLPDARGLHTDVTAVFDGRPGARTTSSERAFARIASGTDVLVGGPPCQGHSAFNNRTRHSDERNSLYLTMVRAAEVLEPDHVVIENVPGALRDRASVVQRSMEDLAALGYEVGCGVVDMVLLGVPQLRRRLVVVASRTVSPDIDGWLERHRTAPRTVRWAIEDLVDVDASALVDTPASSAPQTRGRIDVLFEQDLWELPNEYRPPCHAHGGHSYQSIYGRLRWDQPAQTVTTGFYSMCMGRYVHPSRRRTLTAREAARLQFLPDHIDLSSVDQRGALARLIGNAVPVKLGYVLGLELLR